MMKIIRTLTILSILIASLSTFASSNTNKKVIIQTNFGNIQVELNYEKAPKTVENFLTYVDKGFYDGLIFHRVIDGFMIQGGGFEPNMKQKSTLTPIPNEATNGLRNERGTISMARTSDPHSASSQFFINVVDNGFLDFKNKSTNGWGYCVFGKVTEGQDVVDAIAKVKTTTMHGYQNVPVNTVVIKNVVLAE